MCRPGGGFLKIISVGIPTCAGVKTDLRGLLIDTRLDGIDLDRQTFRQCPSMADF